MKKETLLLSALVFTQLQAVELSEMTVENTEGSVTINDIREDVKKSADLAEGLYKATPSINMIRRSGIANDIVLRGQKRDNINVLIDGAKVYGACPNRMDPTTSHVITNTVESVEVQEGPFDVEESGTLSGVVRITTQKPSDTLEGEVGVNLGSFNYLKYYANTAGGIGDVKVLLSASKESGGQYEDGNGKNFDAQMDAAGYSTKSYKDPTIQAFDKTMFMGKLFWDISDKSSLKMGYMLNRSNDVLYPTTGMDADYDNSDIITANYALKGAGEWSKMLTVDYTLSYVDHPMSTTKRNNASMKIMTNHLNTNVQSLKVKNVLDVANAEVAYGVNWSQRGWEGNYSTTAVSTQVKTNEGFSIPTATTNNVGVFTKATLPMDQLTLRGGVRYDYNHISAQGITGRDFNNFSGNVVASYDLLEAMDLYLGVGHSVRMPDARELYFKSYNMMMDKLTTVGTSSLKEVKNSEVDAGGSLHLGSALLKAKVFYSYLQDYIYFTNSTFVNIDAYIFGGEASAHIDILDNLALDMGLAMQRGKKLEAISGQSDTDLADITPIKANMALEYNVMEDASLKLDMIAADQWRWYDADNGEQAIAGYMVINTKYQQTFAKSYALTLGVDNILNQVYQISNTYTDLTLLSSGGDVILFNEPGRYFYANIAYKF